MDYQGCRWMDSAINFEYDFVSDCCKRPSIGEGQPKLIDNYNGEPIDWEKLFEIKHERISRQKVKTIPECEGCGLLDDYEFKSEKKISDFQFSQCKMCNAKCVYCCPEGCYNMGYNVYPIIKDLIEKGYHKPGGEAIFQGGEPTLMKNFEELVDLLASNGTKIRVLSSAIKYSNKVEEQLAADNCLLVISIDAGDKDTYKKIKSVDKFDIVRENIEKYAKASNNPKNIMIKYIIVPGYNDSLKEIDKFFKLMNNLNIKNIALDIEDHYAKYYEYKDISPHIYLLYDYFIKKAKENNMYEVCLYAFFPYLLENRKIKKSKLIKNKFLYNILIKLNTQKEKNFEYI